MKMNELLNEDTGGDDSGTASATQGGKSTGKTGKMHHNHVTAIKGMNTYPEYPGWYYDMYRFGVNMAGSPDDEHGMDPHSATANQLTTYAYSEADKEIINKSKKNMGIKGKTMTSKDSKETDHTNKTSPVAKPKRNKYGI